MIRRTEDLIDRLNEEFSWRRKEIIAIRSRGIDDSVGLLDKAILRRAGVMVFYAHWEGFVKRAATAYFEFISYQRVPVNEYTDFLILHLVRSRLSENASDREIVEIVKSIATKPDYNPRLPYKKAIDTESNLSSKCLRKICEQIGIDPHNFATRDKFIDSVILKTRNEVAHGARYHIDESEFSDIGDAIIEMSQTFKNLLENCAVLETYRAP